MATTRTRNLTRKQRNALALAEANGLKIATTAQLGRLNAISIANGYNRNISVDGISALDPAGLHVLRVVMTHYHAAGVPVEPHYRLFLLMKLVGSNDPVSVTLDIPIGAWDGLAANAN